LAFPKALPGRRTDDVGGARGRCSGNDCLDGVDREKKRRRTRIELEKKKEISRARPLPLARRGGKR